MMSASTIKCICLLQLFWSISVSASPGSGAAGNLAAINSNDFDSVYVLYMQRTVRGPLRHVFHGLNGLWQIGTLGLANTFNAELAHHFILVVPIPKQGSVQAASMVLIGAVNNDDQTLILDTVNGPSGANGLFKYAQGPFDPTGADHSVVIGCQKIDEAVAAMTAVTQKYGAGFFWTPTVPVGVENPNFANCHSIAKEIWGIATQFATPAGTTPALCPTPTPVACDHCSTTTSGGGGGGGFTAGQCGANLNLPLCEQGVGYTEKLAAIAVRSTLACGSFGKYYCRIPNPRGFDACASTNDRFYGFTTWNDISDGYYYFIGGSCADAAGNPVDLCSVNVTLPNACLTPNTTGGGTSSSSSTTGDGGPALPGDGS